MDNLLTAVLYTLLTGVVSFFYWFEGHRKGVKETLSVFNEYEPEALKRMQFKIRELLNVADSQ